MIKMLKNPPKDLLEVEWEAPEYEAQEKSPGWYFVLSALAIILIALSFYAGNPLFAFFILIATIILASFSKREPEIFKFKINKEGVAIGEEVFHYYDSLDGFGVLEHSHKLDEVVIHKKRLLTPFIKLPIDSRTLPRAKRILKKHLPEKEYQDSLIDVISERLRI